MKKMKPLFALTVGLVLLFGCTPKENDGVTPTQPTNVGAYSNPLTIFDNGKLDTGWGDFIGPDGSTQFVTITNSSPITMINAAGATIYYPATPAPVTINGTPEPATVSGPVTTVIPGGVVNGVATAGEGYMSYTVTGFTALDICGACTTSGNYGVNLLFGASSGYQDYGEHFVNLSSGNFTSVKFYAMASSATSAVNFSAFGDAGVAPALTTTWQQFSFPVGASLNSIEMFFDVFITGYPSAPNFIEANQLPFTVYVDDVTYQ